MRAALLAAGLCSGALQAATPFPGNGGTPNVAINIAGSVGMFCTFVYTPNPAARGIDLAVGAPQGIVIATLNEWCNNRNGFTVTITSTNKGLVRDGETKPQPWAYDIGYGNIFAPSASSLSVTRGQPAFDNEVPITMRFNAMTRAVSGSYGDTINVVVAATT